MKPENFNLEKNVIEEIKENYFWLEGFQYFNFYTETGSRQNPKQN